MPTREAMQVLRLRSARVQLELTVAPGADAQPTTGHDLFATKHLQENLKGRSIRGGAATLGGQATTFALKLSATAVLARLLTPADFGLIAMVTALTGFVQIFKDAGLSMATVQRAEINHRQVSTLFWGNLALSFVLMLIVASMAPAVAWFYGEPRLLAVTLALAALFPLGGLTVQHQALLRRQMRFGTLVSIDVASQAIGVAAGIGAALLGATYWALVAMLAGTALANALLVWLLCRWLPGLPSRGSGVRPMLAFGGNLTAFTFFNYFARNADNALIGWYCGASAVGLYARAYSLMLLPMYQIKEPLSAVVVPALCRLQDKQEDFARYYLRAVNGMMWLCGPLVAFLAACSEQVVLIVLGDQWMAAVNLFRVLAVIAFLQPIYSSAVGWTFCSRGRADRLLRWAMVACPLTLASFVAGLPYGPLGVAVAYTVVFLMLLPWTLDYAFAGTGLTIRRVGEVVAKPFAVSFAAYMSAMLVNCSVDAGSHLAKLAVSFLAAVSTIVAVSVLVPAIRREVRTLLRSVAHYTSHSHMLK